MNDTIMLGGSRSLQECTNATEKKSDKIWESFLPFVSQWYWHKNWLNEWSKAFYHGPRIEWMYLENEKVEPPKDA